MPALNIIELNVDNKTHSYARIYASLIQDEYQRKRAYASIVALYALANTIEKTNNVVQKSMTLFREPKLNEEYEISDFYVNNWHVDVRVLVDGDAVLLPKKHFDNNILPDFYAVVKVSKSLNTAELLGFIDAKNANKQPLDYHYFSATVDGLIPYSEFLSRIEDPKVVDFAEEEHQKFREKYLSLLDEELDAETKSSLLRHMFACPMCRTEFCCFTGFEMVSCNMGKYPDLVEDQTLNIIGATDVDNPKYEGKEETIKIVDDDEEQVVLSEDNTKQEQQEEQEKQEDVVEDTIVEEEILEEVLDDNNQIVEDEALDDLALLDSPSEQIEEVQDLVMDEFGIVETSIADSDLVVEDFEDDVNKQILMAEMPENNLEIDTTPINDIVEEKEETVSDILDELFSIDEVYEDSTFQEKGVDIEPKQETEIEEIAPSEDFVENYTDEFSDEFSDVKDTDFIERDLKIVDEVQSDPSREFEYDDEEEAKVKNDFDDIEIHDIVEDKTIPIDTNSDIESIDINNVIVDYDEKGNPIYSYITDIPEEIVSDDNMQMETIEDIQGVEEFENIDDCEETENYDILDEQYATYSAAPTREYDISEISTDAPLPYEEYDEPIIDNYPEQEENIELTPHQEEEEYSDNVATVDTETDFEETSDVDYEQNEYESEFDSDDYVDETDESIPEERTSSGNPLVALILLLGIVAGSVFGGYKVYQHFTASDKPVAEQTEENIVTEIDNSELLTEQTEENVVNEEQKAEEIVENIEEVKTVEKTVPVEKPIQTADSANLPKLPEVAPTSGNIDLPPLTENDLLKNKQQTNNVNKSMASAFSSNSSSVSVKNINWLCTPQLFTDATFKAFLQDIDGLLKMNMRKNILNATETPKNPNVSVKMAIDNNGKIEKIMVSESSGSEQIDNIVLQSINESLTGKKSPILNDGKLKADRYHLKVVIKL